MKRREFDKAKLISVKWVGREFFRWRPDYGRMANCARLSWFGIEVVWRMPWLKEAAFEKGWDACYRTMTQDK